jgi:enamine deaminase RidA (YjgF/YER057c/UK114 family)
MRVTTSVAAAVALLAASLDAQWGGMGGGMGGRHGGYGRQQRGAESETRAYLNPLTLATLPGFTHAVKVGPVIYVSGELPLDSAGQLVGADDLRAQARRVFANLEVALRLAWAQPTDVVELRMYLVNLSPSDVQTVREAAPQFFPARNPPAGTVLGVTALPVTGALIVVDAVAIIPADRMRGSDMRRDGS